MDIIEERRAQARQHRGVWYDARADKFVAEVYSKGDRHFLGHFATAEEAAQAYVKAREDLPSGRDVDGSFVQAFQTFLDTALLDKNGAPEVGETLTYKDQSFYFVGVVFRSMKGRKRPFYMWDSQCLTCGGVYGTMTATSAATAKGITRNCEEHRAGARVVRKETPKVDAAPQDWIDVATAAADVLSILSDDFDIDMFFQQCRADHPDLPRAFNRFVFESPQSPVVSRDGRFYPRNV